MLHPNQLVSQSACISRISFPSFPISDSASDLHKMWPTATRFSLSLSFFLLLFHSQFSIDLQAERDDWECVDSDSDSFLSVCPLLPFSSFPNWEDTGSIRISHSHNQPFEPRPNKPSLSLPLCMSAIHSISITGVLRSLSLFQSDFDWMRNWNCRFQNSRIWTVFLPI